VDNVRRGVRYLQSHFIETRFVEFSDHVQVSPLIGRQACQDGADKRLHSSENR
jgi:hypothetical protein